MRDYNYINERGESVPVSQMDKVDIINTITNGCYIIESDNGETVYDVIERLRIELTIRELGL